MTINNNGLTGDMLSQLLGGNLNTATPEQITSVVPPSSTPFTPQNEAPPADQSQQPGASQTSPTMWYWIGGGVLGLILLIFLFRK